MGSCWLLMTLLKVHCRLTKTMTCCYCSCCYWKYKKSSRSWCVLGYRSSSWYRRNRQNSHRKCDSYGLFPAVVLLFIIVSPTSAASSPSVLFVYEECDSVANIVKDITYNASISLPCGSSSITQLPDISPTSLPRVVVVMATCDIINVVAAAMGGENIRLREVQLLPVPTLTPRCHVPLSAGFCTSFNVDPFRQVLDLMFSWMIYHSWTQLTILYDQSLNIMANIAIVKSFLVTNKRLGARLSFKEVPAQLATSSASRNQLETALKELLEAWGEEEARHLALIGDKSTIIHVLRMIPNLEDDDSNSDWLIFTSTNDDVSKEYIPANGHRVYFVNRSLHAGLREDVRTALRVGEAVARGVATCWNTTSIKEIVETPVTIYMKPPNYSAMLIPPVEVPGPSQTRLVPLYTWSPSSSSTSSPHLFSGRFKALPSYDQYQLHGAHLYVATLRSAPFIKPVEAPVDEHAWEGSNRTQKPPSPQLPHVTCPQPLAFVGFLKDMLDVLSIQMNFTYTLYEVCDGSYGSLVDGRWTGVVGEVMYGYAHIGLSNLGANYARSHAVSFPRVSTSYGGAGIIFKRPQKEARDLLTVYLLPFSTNVWICIAISIPVAAFTMYLTTRPRLSLRSLLRRRPPSHARPTSLLESSGESFVPRSRVVESDGKRNPLKKYLRVKPLTTSPLHCFYQDNFFGQGGDVEDEGETKKKDKMRQHTVDSKTLQKAKKKKKVEEEEEETEDVPQSFLSSLWFAATVFMQQGQEVVPERYPARLVFGSMWVASVVLYASYTSNLVSYFTVNKSTLPINNLEELVKSDYKFGTRAGSVYGDNMKASKSEVYKAASAKLESFGKEVTMGTYEEAIQRTLQESYAFIGDYVVLDYYQMKDCNLVLLKQQLFQTMSSFVLPRHSPILPAVNYYMSLMDESGILEKLRQRWWRGQPCEDIGTVTAYQSLGLWEVCSAGLLMLVGVVMAVLVCCLEHAGPRLHHTSLITRTTTSNRNRSISSECIPSSQRCSTNTTHGQVLKTVLSD